LPAKKLVEGGRLQGTRAFRLELKRRIDMKDMNNMKKELWPLFDALDKAKKQLGEGMVLKIKEKLAAGSFARHEANFLQNKRREAMAAALGMTSNEYEGILKVNDIKGSSKPKNYKQLWNMLMG